MATKIQKNNDGYVCIPRKILSLPYYNERVQFTKRDALVDLYFSVRYSSETLMQIINGRVVGVNRGEMIAALRFLGNRWQWSKNKVANFLKQLEKDGIIETSETQAGTKLRIIDYSSPSKRSRQSGQDEGHHESMQTRISGELRDGEGDSNQDIEGTLTGQRRDKSVSKDENKGGSKEKIEQETASPVIKERFIKPTKEDIEDYLFTEKNLDSFTAMGFADRFFNYYEANGWKVGRNPMKNWKAAVNNWLSKNKENATTKSKQPSADDLREFVYGRGASGTIEKTAVWMQQ